MRAFALTVIAAAGAAAIPSAARADLYVGGGLMVTGGIGELHLGEIVGEPRDGGDDLSGRRGGIYLRAGVFRGPFEIGPRVGIALGGLSLSRVERVYYDSNREALGGASVVDAALELRFEQDVLADWVPYGGAAVGVERLAASSPAGSAWVDAAFAEASAGLSFPLGAGPISGGRIDAGVMLRVSGAYRAYLDGELTSADRIRYFGSPGITVSYTYRL